MKWASWPGARGKCALILTVFLLQLTTRFICHSNKGFNTTKCPNKDENGTFINVAYTKAEGKDDIIHYLITSVGTPAVLIAKTKRNVSIHVHWKKFLSTENVTNAVYFHEDEQPQYIFTLLLNRVRKFHLFTSGLFFYVFFFFFFFLTNKKTKTYVLLSKNLL